MCNVHFICMLFSAMIFENCTDDYRSGNILTSPELTVTSDQHLTFTMLSVPNNHHSTVNVYKTSSLGHIDTLLGSYSADFSVSKISVDENVTHDICLPVGTYQLVFIASEADDVVQPDVIQSTVAFTEVQLTNSSCTNVSFVGN